jgi:hypothetical protein
MTTPQSLECRLIRSSREKSCQTESPNRRSKIPAESVSVSSQFHRQPPDCFQVSSSICFWNGAEALRRVCRIWRVIVHGHPEVCLQFVFGEETRQCVTACTESERRFFTQFFCISLAMWAFTVRSSMPNNAPISLFDRPPTSISKTSFSRSVKLT